MDTPDRIVTLRRAGFGRDTIAAILGVEPSEVASFAADPAQVPALPGGGGFGPAAYTRGNNQVFGAANTPRDIIWDAFVNVDATTYEHLEYRVGDAGDTLRILRSGIYLLHFACATPHNDWQAEAQVYVSGYEGPYGPQGARRGLSGLVDFLTFLDIEAQAEIGVRVTPFTAAGTLGAPSMQMLRFSDSLAYS